MARYQLDGDVNLERKLDPYPEAVNFLSNIMALEEIKTGDIGSSEEAYQDLSPEAYHEIFSDPRLEQEEVLTVDETSLEDMQRALERTRPEIMSRPKNMFFRKGYSNSPSNLVDEPGTDMKMMEEALMARKNPYQESGYVLEGVEAPGESLPFVGSFQKGRQKASSDKFYNLAAPRLRNRIGDTEIKVE